MLVNNLLQFQFVAVPKLLWGIGEDVLQQEVSQRLFISSLLFGWLVIVGSCFEESSSGD